ncbi:MAG TPA: type II toxin-antitoxin system VapB family antitoxin [Conexibacter sp.]|nr:type II toxin-antitoxin system VapB family antitoxin [Conexibacter sp.]
MTPPKRRHPSRRKTSFELDFEKVEAARRILGTRTLTETVDAALDEVVKREGRRQLVELLHTPGLLALNDPDVMAGAWR